MRTRLLRVLASVVFSLLVLSGVALAVDQPAQHSTAQRFAAQVGTRRPGLELRLVGRRLEQLTKRVDALSKSGSAACQTALTPVKQEITAAQGSMSAVKTALTAKNRDAARTAAQVLRQKLKQLRTDLLSARTACGAGLGAGAVQANGAPGAQQGKLPQPCHDAFVKERKALSQLLTPLRRYHHALALKIGVAAAATKLQAAESAQNAASQALTAACGSS
jgi:hypothetical protein